MNKPPPSLPPLPTPRRFSPLQSELPAPPPTRTRLAVNLQLGRCFSSIVALVRDGYEGKTESVRAEARLISSAILTGARDRSRDPHLRTLRDQQRRSAPLRNKRPPRNKATRGSPPVSKAAARSGDAKPSSAPRGSARLHASGYLSIRCRLPRSSMRQLESSDKTRARAEQSYQVAA